MNSPFDKAAYVTYDNGLSSVNSFFFLLFFFTPDFTPLENTFCGKHFAFFNALTVNLLMHSHTTMADTLRNFFVR